VKLSYARDRLVENCGVFHEEEYSRARMLFAKTFGMLSLMDDTYDVYATLEECHVLNEAIQRYIGCFIWKLSGKSNLNKTVVEAVLL
jgi:hypothetical protein